MTDEQYETQETEQQELQHEQAHEQAAHESDSPVAATATTLDPTAPAVHPTPFTCEPPTHSPNHIQDPAAAVPGVEPATMDDVAYSVRSTITTLQQNSAVNYPGTYIGTAVAQLQALLARIDAGLAK